MKPVGPDQLSLALVWESELVRSGDGTVKLVAKKPVAEMSTAKAGKILTLSEWSVRKLWRLGEIDGYKPGGVKRRKDGKGSNARLVLYADSVLAYKAKQQAEAAREQASGIC